MCDDPFRVVLNFNNDLEVAITRLCYVVCFGIIGYYTKWAGGHFLALAPFFKLLLTGCMIVTAVLSLYPALLMLYQVSSFFATVHSYIGWISGAPSAFVKPLHNVTSLLFAAHQGQSLNTNPIF